MKKDATLNNNYEQNDRYRIKIPEKNREYQRQID